MGLFVSSSFQEMAKEDPVCVPESMDSEDMLFLLYTSGSTGVPKGLVHTQAGYLLYAALTHRVQALVGKFKGAVHHTSWAGLWAGGQERLDLGLELLL